MKQPLVKFPVKLPNVLPVDAEEDGRPKYKLEVPFIVIINGTQLVIPAGIVFDYASIPRAFWCIMLPNDPDYQAASLHHDVAYQGELWERSYNDKLFLAAMTSTGVEKWKRNVMYAAVRLGGGFTYRKHTYETIQNVRMLMGITDMESPYWKKEW